jgi:2-oxoisovalerate dehydrogenase E1 component
MPKSQFINPDAVRKPGVITIPDIPLNSYVPDFKKEIASLGRERLIGIFRDMTLIREFESMLHAIKITGSYEGIEYTHRGPAHLSVGQESAAVGECVHLGPEDFIFGSHRSHGEILAKCLSAVEKLDEKALMKVMEGYLDGAVLRAVELGRGAAAGGGSGVKRLAVSFVLFGTLAEIFGKATGFNRGLGGSMHAFFAPFGSMPNNAIVGGSADIAVGSALFKRVNRRPGVVIANIGDASMGCGPVWEGMMLAAMDQYRTLWPKEAGGAPPVMFNFFNNFYGMGGQTYGETMGFTQLARVGAGVNAENMHAERVDGYNPLAVADAILRKKKILLEGKGPVLLDTITYRFSGHSPSDASSYRTKEEIQAWQNADAVAAYGEYLEENKVLSESGLAGIWDEARREIVETLKKAIDPEISPRVDGPFIEGAMFSGKKEDRMAEGAPEVLIPRDENPRVQAMRGKARFALDPEGKRLPKTKVFSYRDALFEAILHRFYEDPTMAAWGEENRDWGGAFAVYRGLTEALPYPRLFNAPISEGAIVGAGVGYALSGGRALVELMYCDFMGRAGDEIFNQASKWQAMSAGVLAMPLVVRVSVGDKYGAQHSQDWTSMVAHVPGLKVMYPSTPYDAKGMMNLALRGTDPVIFFESQRLYDVGELFMEGGVPEGFYEVPEGEPSVKREGKDLTIVTIGAALYAAMEAAKILSERHSLSAEVMDLRFMNPLRYSTLLESVKKTGRVLLVSEACERGSFLHTVASSISQLGFDDLDAPPAVVGSRNWITPAAEMESLFFPQKEWIIDTIHERIMPLPGHTASTVQTSEEMERRNAWGV